MAPETRNNNAVSGRIVPPTLSPLNVNSDNMVCEWQYWRRSFERYCRLASISSEENMKDIFYAYIGRQTEEYIRDLPNFGNLVTVAQLLGVVESRYSKAPNTLCERYKFRNVKIRPNETIVDFNARLNSYSKNCDFEHYTRDKAHLDQLILNATPKLREKLLLEQDLTLTKALDIAKYTLQGNLWCNQFDGSADTTKQEVNFNKNDSNNFKHFKKDSNKNFKASSKKCLRCGSGKHLANSNDCPARKVKCHSCEKIGHFAKYCLAGKDSKLQMKVDYGAEVPRSEEFCVIPVCRKVNAVDHRHMIVEVNGIKVDFIIDSGSQATIIPLSIFRTLNSKLQPANDKLVDYNGRKITCEGQAMVDVSSGTDRFKGRIFVTKDKKPLLGLDWIRCFSGVNWNTLLVGEVKSTDSVANLTSKFKSVFEDKPEDKVRGFKAKLVQTMQFLSSWVQELYHWQLNLKWKLKSTD